jgi:hypothetical protein
MKMKIDLGQFKLKKKDENFAHLQHKDGHEFRVAIKALHPENRKNLDALEPVKPIKKPKVKMAKGGELSDEQILENKKLVDDYNKTHEDEPVDYPPSVKKRMEETDVTPKRLADGGDVDPLSVVRSDRHISEDDLAKGLGVQAMANGGDIDYPAIESKLAEDNKPYVEPAPSDAQAPTPMTAPVSGIQDQALPVSLSGAPDMAPAIPQPEAAAPKAMQPSASSLAPKQPGMPAQPDLEHAYKTQQAGIMEQQKAEQMMAQEQLSALKANAKANLDMQTQFQQHAKATQDELNNLMEDYKAGHIDPNHFMGTRDTGQKIAIGISLFLGGLSSGITGRGNDAMDFLNKQIDRDIDAQKAELGKKHTLFSFALQKYGNMRDAADFTRLAMNDMLKNKLEQAASSSNNVMAQARAKQALGALEAQSAPIFQQFNMRQMLSSSPSAAQQGHGDLNQMDPAVAVPMLVPEKDRAKVFGEIEAAQNTKRMHDSILKSFDEAAKDNTVLKTGAGILRTPASVYSLHQAMQPTFKDLEGTVRQAAMDNTFKNITPMPGDLDGTIATKRQALVDYLQSKASAPTAKGYGIDLEKFQSTAALPESRLSPQQKSFLDWARKNPKDPRSAAVLKKLGINE